MADDPDRIPKMNRAAVDSLAVHVAAVGAGQIHQHDLRFGKLQHRVFTADLIVVQDNVVGVESPDVQDGIRRDLVDDFVIHGQVNGRTALSYRFLNDRHFSY